MSLLYKIKVQFSHEFCDKLSQISFEYLSLGRALHNVSPLWTVDTFPLRAPAPAPVFSAVRDSGEAGAGARCPMAISDRNINNRNDIRQLRDI